MAVKTTKLTAPNGIVVSVDESKVEELTRRGFTAESSSTKAPAKKSTSGKSSK